MNLSIKTPIAVIGMGRSGKSAYNLLRAMGVSSDQICTFDFKAGDSHYSDPNKMMFQFNPKSFVVSPGVPLELDWIQSAKKSGVEITSEINLASHFLTSEKIIGVTGSLGKSTTVSLLEEGLKSFSNNFFVGGNIGIPYCEYALQLITKKRTAADWIVLELSSYQLENSANLKLDYSAITYFAANHLERYSSKEEYYQTKWDIYKLTRNQVFLNFFGGDVVTWLQNHPNSNFQIVSKNDSEFYQYELNKNQLIGTHNVDNLALSTKLAKVCQWPESSIYAMKKFKGLRHRLENLGFIKDRKFINDSKATTIESVISAVSAALEELPNKNQLHILIGGRDKGLPWHLLSSLKEKNNLCFYFFGECGLLAKEMSTLPGTIFKDLESATLNAFQQSYPQDCILLSPGGTSLDQFSSFEARGDFFEKYIQTI